MSHYAAPDYLAIIHRRDKSISAYMQAFLDLLLAG